MTTAVWNSLVKPRLEKARRLPLKQGVIESFRACCPAHDDEKPSFSAALLDDGRILLHCHSQQCDFSDVVASLGITARDAGPDHKSHHTPPVATAGVAAWGSAAAAADAAIAALIDALVYKSADKILAAIDAVESFRAAARHAMRAQSRAKGGAT